MNTLTKEEIKKIAELAKLDFSNEELDKFAGEFNHILDYVSQIQECDTTGIEFEHNLSDFKGRVLQEDVVKPSLSQDKLLKNATDGRSKYGYIVTSKIINKD
ncbi:MAG: Asp-tRNA(Asn)/Glu-tRNA(Gln) amidotransferase subunit GatC [Candidatus Dojkabacteria bacterium]